MIVRSLISLLFKVSFHLPGLLSILSFIPYFICFYQRSSQSPSLLGNNHIAHLACQQCAEQIDSNNSARCICGCVMVVIFLIAFALILAFTIPRYKTS